MPYPDKTVVYIDRDIHAQIKIMAAGNKRTMMAELEELLRIALKNKKR